MKIGIVYNKFIQNEAETLKTLNLAFKKCKNYKIMNSEEIQNSIEFDFIFAIGGDGTIIKVAKTFANTNIPVMGINLGRLGFLAQSELSEISEIIDKILAKQFKTDSRTLLESKYNIALNDFVIKGSEQSRTTKFILKINNVPTCEYVADGLIIATPTGSTAYCLSAGGPIISPNVPAFVIVPICPHTLTARPLVVPDTEQITICSAPKEAPLAITSDGFSSNILTNTIDIKKSNKKILLAFLENNQFYKVLSEKLYWGISPCKND